MNNSTFLRNLMAGKHGEDLLKGALVIRDFLIVETGQENWLPHEIYEQIKTNNDQMALSIRHTPDLLTYHYGLDLTYWDAKVKTNTDTVNFYLGLSFYTAMLNRHDYGQRIVIAFLDTDGVWRCNWVEDLEVRSWFRNVPDPYVVIARDSTFTLDMFLSINSRMGGV